MSAREGTLVRIVTDAGIVGWGEASPYPGFGLESVAEARSALGRAARRLLGLRVDEREAGWSILRAEADEFPTARAGLETAMLDIEAQQKGMTFREWLVPSPARRVDSVSCNALVVGSDLSELGRSAAVARAKGFETFKLKVGANDLDVDLSRVACLRDVVGPDAAIRLDANQAYDLEAASAAIEGFARYEIEYLEQPLAIDALDDMAGLREKSPIALAADESATTESGTARVIEAGAADVIVIKPSAAGGPLASLRIARAARRAGLRVVVTTLLDSAIAVSSAREVAGAIASQFELPACGLATNEMFEYDVTEVEPVANGSVPLGRAPGLGIHVPEESLRRCLSGPVVDLSV